MKEDIKKLIWVPSPEEIQREKEWITKEIEAIGLIQLENLAHSAYRPKTSLYSSVALRCRSSNT